MCWLALIKDYLTRKVKAPQSIFSAVWSAIHLVVASRVGQKQAGWGHALM